MPQKTRSAYCEVCGAQRSFTKQTFRNEVSALGAAKLAGNALKKYRCVICGSPKGTKAPKGMGG